MSCVIDVFAYLNTVPESRRVRTEFVCNGDYSIYYDAELRDDKNLKLFPGGSIFSSVKFERDVIVISEEWRVLEGNTAIPFWMCLIWDNYRSYIDYRKVCGIAEILGVTPGEMLCLTKNKTGKRIIASYGNCQIMSINSILESSSSFMMDYIILNLPPVQEIRIEEVLSRDILEQIDALIYQNVSDDNKWSVYHSTTYITDNLREDAKKVCIPNVYFTGYYPQYISNKYNPMKKEIVNGLMPYGDRNIEEMFLVKKMPCEDICNAIVADCFYSEEEVLINNTNSLLELTEREKVCDVTISDYIEQHYRENKLFYAPNHPTNEILLVLVNRALHYLQLDYTDLNVSGTFENDSRIVPIYPSVEKALGLSFSQGKFYYRRGFQKAPSDLKEYCKDYIYYCFEINADLLR